MDKQKAILIAKALFESHSNATEFHITSDSQAFFADHQAANHARGTLKDNIVIKVTKAETLTAVTTEKTQSEKLGAAQQKVNDINANVLKTQKLQAEAKTEETKAKHQATLDKLAEELEAARKEIGELEGAE